MRRTPLLVCCLAFVTFASRGTGLAKDSSTVEVEAELRPCCGSPAPQASGEAERKTKSKKGGKEDEFEGKVKIPIPSPGLEIFDRDDATIVDIRMLLNRNGSPYAECELDFDKVQEQKGQVRAEYKVKVRQRKGSLRHNKGQCDTALSTPGVQFGIPAVQAGDTATATLVEDPNDRAQDRDFLEGTFVPD